MSTLEKAYQIMQQLTDEQLDLVLDFLNLISNDTVEQKERTKAYKVLEELRVSAPNVNEKAELAEYRKEKYD